MTQFIVAKSSEGLIMAADSKGTTLEELSSMITSKMHSLKKADDSSISSPLHVATITSQGVVEQTL